MNGMTTTRTKIVSTRMNGIRRKTRSWPSHALKRASTPGGRVAAPARGEVPMWSELVNVDAALHAAAPGLDLLGAADVLGHAVPALGDALGGLLGGDVAAHHVGEVVVQDLEVLVVALDPQQRDHV